MTAGIPLVIVEYAIGQKYQGGAPQALASVTKKFRWVGWLALLVGTTIVLYYVPVMGYACHYAVSSLTVDWTEPAPKVEVVNKKGAAPRKKVIPPDRIQLYMRARGEKHEKRLEKLKGEKYGEDAGFPTVPVLRGERFLTGRVPGGHGQVGLVSRKRSLKPGGKTVVEGMERKRHITPGKAQVVGKVPEGEAGTRSGKHKKPLIGRGRPGAHWQSRSRTKRA